MPKIPVKEVRQIARLARLTLEDNEVERLGQELSSILEHMDVLKSVDTDGVEPLTHPVPMDLPLRADEAGESLPEGRVLADAPRTADGCFQVPNIIKSGAGNE